MLVVALCVDKSSTDRGQWASENRLSKDLGQSPIQSAQILTACG